MRYIFFDYTFLARNFLFPIKVAIHSTGFVRLFIMAFIAQQSQKFSSSFTDEYEHLRGNV